MHVRRLERQLCTLVKQLRDLSSHSTRFVTFHEVRDGCPGAAGVPATRPPECSSRVYPEHPQLERGHPTLVTVLWLMSGVHLHACRFMRFGCLRPS